MIAMDVVSTASCLPGYTKCASWYTTLVGLDGRSLDAGGVNAVWSPSGGELLVRGGLFSLEDASEWILGLTRADGSNGWDTKTGWKRPDACWAGGSWSPDGSRLVLTESRCDGSARRLHIVGARDGVRRAIVRGCCASWSPDGRRLAYIAFQATGNALTVATRDGRRLHALGRTSHYAWSPRGERLAFVRPSKAGDELVIARANRDRSACSRADRAPRDRDRLVDARRSSLRILPPRARSGGARGYARRRDTSARARAQSPARAHQRPLVRRRSPSRLLGRPREHSRPPHGRRS